MIEAKLHEHVPSETAVKIVCAGGNTLCDAPKEPGTYSLYELTYESTGAHAGWRWEREHE